MKRALPISIIGLLVACGDAGTGLGVVCADDDVCAAGLTCEPVQDTACNTISAACTAPCVTDSDCIGFDASGRCFDDPCTMTRQCGLAANGPGITGMDLPPAAVCAQSAECRSGLECVASALDTNGTCTEGTPTCTKTCTADPDCADLGTDFFCVAGCNMRSLCAKRG